MTDRMIPTLRPYQQQLKSDIYAAWAAGVPNVMAVAPTGSGKTTVMASIMRDEKRPCIVIAHRQELVSQMSLALARHGVRHRVIGQPATIRMCVQMHMIDLGVSYYNANASAAVAGVDTLVRMKKEAWHNNIALWLIDEGHHVVGATEATANKWGKATYMFPNARGLSVTATPLRADGKGLGRHADGVIDAMVLAPSMSQLMKMGFLSGYRIFAPPNDIDLSNVTTSAGGDYSPEPLRAAVRRSHIHGDVVAHYLRIAGGARGLTFAVDVESAVELAAAFRQQGVPAEAVSGKTPDNIRYKILQQLAAGDIKQVCSCDIIGEGLDIPAVEVISMARPTQSYGLYIQQIGRGLRPKTDGGVATILDHVNNVILHGLPDAERIWSLDRRERRSRSTTDDAPIPLRSCLNCAGVYERTRVVCPYCGHQVVPSGRSSPELVDGDLAELTPDVLARMRGEIATADSLRIPYNAAPEVVGAVRRNHRERMEAQQVLRERMMLWGGARTARGVSLAEAQREFYLRHGVDVASAQLLNRADALALTERIKL